MPPRRYAFVYGATLGVGGLGVQAANALRALALGGAEVHAIGPGPAPGWSAPPNVTWHLSPTRSRPLLSSRPFRRYAGLTQYVVDRAIGGFAGAELDRVRPDVCYGFTQVALETLAWARQHSVVGVVESPNGHIRGFRDVYVAESRQWGGGRYVGHPSPAMTRRVEEEYETASHVRVSSQWSKQSLIAGGVPAATLTVLQQPVDLDRYSVPTRERSTGPLRVCFVGALDLRKGFVYLLQAARQTATPLVIEMVGGTGDRCSAALFARERTGVSVEIASGDPRPALARADLFALPTLEDGSPFAVAEAMSSGLPVLTTMATGAAEWIRPAESGWIVPPRSVDALVTTLAQAESRRSELREMGMLARRDTEARVEHAVEAASDWVKSL